MSTTASLQARLDRHKFNRCSVPGCYDLVQGVSHHCNAHKLRALRYGGPLRRAIRQSELQPYARLVDRFIKVNRDHPALAEAHARLQVLLDIAARGDPPVARGPYDWTSRLTKELRRLHQGGTTGAEVFRAVAIVWLFADREPAVVSPMSRPHRYAVARQVLSLRTREAYRGSTQVGVKRFSSLVLDHLGEQLLALLLPVLRAMSRTLSTHNLTKEPHTHV